MKATGIVRRIDDLGRVVIPKEIRRTMRIREGDPLEIYTSNDGEVIFKKYSAISEMSENAAQVADIMCKLAACPVVIFDRDHVVAVSADLSDKFIELRMRERKGSLGKNRTGQEAERAVRLIFPDELSVPDDDPISLTDRFHREKFLQIQR